MAKIIIRLSAAAAAIAAFVAAAAPISAL